MTRSPPFSTPRPPAPPVTIAKDPNTQNLQSQPWINLHKVAEVLLTQGGSSKRAFTHARNKSSIGMAGFLMSDSPVKPNSRQGFSASATPPVVGTSAIPQTHSGEMDPSNTITRQQIINAVLRGDVDHALEEMAKHYPKVLLETGSPLVGDGLMKFKLRCRKLVELVLEAAETNPGPKSQNYGDRVLVHLTLLAEELHKAILDVFACIVHPFSYICPIL